MRMYAVVVVNTGFVAWIGESENPIAACATATRQSGENVAGFRSTDHFDEVDDLEILLVNVYDLTKSAVAWSLKDLQARPDMLDEDLFVGTFAAPYVR